METPIQTSFIPKKPMDSSPSVSSSSNRPTNWILFIATIIFIASLALAVGVYFHRAYLIKQQAALDSQIERAKASFEPEFVSDIEKLDRKLTASSKILENHITASPVFELLSTLTLKQIRYSEFSFTVDENNVSNARVLLSGKADGYRTIALQADLFSSNRNIIDPIFSNLVLDEKGQVLFDLAFEVPIDSILYENNLAE
jgi:hypothetical protein